MNELLKKDLTRWNRSGLDHFRYIDGNAVTYLEALRLALSAEFTTADGQQQWTDLETLLPVKSTEQPTERQQRWLQQYYAGRRDYGWEILRSYARACHVLTEHVDIYANESYLNTATQWDNVRRLVEMIDYHPAPPASAATPLAVLVKDGKSGMLEQSFAVKNVPPTGKPPAIFETLADLDVSADMNVLYALDWNRSQLPFDFVLQSDGTYTAVFPLAEAVDGLSRNGVGVLQIDIGASNSLGIGVEISDMAVDSLTLKAWDLPVDLPTTVLRHQVSLLLLPQYKQTPLISGNDVVTLATGHGLVVNDVMAWNTGGWKLGRVAAVDGARVRFEGPHGVPETGAVLYRTLKASVQAVTVDNEQENWVILPLASLRADSTVWDVNLNVIYSGKIHTVSGGYYNYIESTNASSVYYIPVTASSNLPRVLASTQQTVTLPGRPKGLAAEDWVVVNMAASRQVGSFRGQAKKTNGRKVVDVADSRQAARIVSITEAADHFELGLFETVTGAELIFGDFKLHLYPAQYQQNQTPIFSLTERASSYSVIPLSVTEWPELLEIGRLLLIAGDGAAMQVTVQDVDAAMGLIWVSPAIPGSEPTGTGVTANYSRHATRIYGNVVMAGHGERQSVKVLGSGDATQRQQQFDFNFSDVSQVSDALFATGVRADVGVEVEGRIWQQVVTLNDSMSEDAHYTVRMREDGTLRIGFGDGTHGRRLPTGNSNIRIRYRIGAGVVGNLDAGSLIKIVKPHSLISSVVQSLASTGGNDMESVASMCSNAPASVLTLERAVSLSDFTYLTMQNSSVWQANAIRHPPGLGYLEQIEVAVVPAGGGELGSLQQTLRDYLRAHALPGVSVQVSCYVGVIFDLDIIIRVKSAEYDPDQVAEQVRIALLAEFALQGAAFGTTLYRSQLYKVVESVAGMENCYCAMLPDAFLDQYGVAVSPQAVLAGPDGDLKRVTALPQQVIYLDELLSTITITTEEYSL